MYIQKLQRSSRLAVCALLCACILILPGSAFPCAAEAPLRWCDFQYEIIDGGVRLTRYLGIDRDVVIPAAIKGLPVRSLADGLFSDSGALIESLTLYGAAEDFEGAVYSQMQNLKTISLPEGYKNMSMHAFSDCIFLENVYMPEDLESIGPYSFQNCPRLTDVFIPSGVTMPGWSFRLSEEYPQPADRCALLTQPVPDSNGEAAAIAQGRSYQLLYDLADSDVLAAVEAEDKGKGSLIRARQAAAGDDGFSDAEEILRASHPNLALDTLYTLDCADAGLLFPARAVLPLQRTEQVKAYALQEDRLVEIPIPPGATYVTADLEMEGNTSFLVTEPRPSGDLDGDWAVTIDDVMEACKALARKSGGQFPRQTELAWGDLNRDDRLEIRDVMEICKLLARNAF